MEVDTIVYIDGFNLYYRALKANKQFRWLDLEALCKNILPDDSNIKKINFYTARVSSKIDNDAPRKQQIYFKALKTSEIVEVIFGEFRIRNKFAKLTEPLTFRPKLKQVITPKPNFVSVSVAEEKGSDVKLGVHLVRDGFQGKYQRAVVITNDIDLAEPIKIVKEELNLEVILLKPNSQPLATLDKNATRTILIETTHLANSQFPDEIGGTKRPSTWK
ncbi:NYN domain-containing protein [Psychrobacter aquimaris]|uniref:NYN domain-containing protein n=1 Tax=Psychrobacter aquimaris TaxID=292733 RepID=UPI003FD660B4